MPEISQALPEQYGERGFSSTKKGGLRPLFNFVSPLEGDRKLRTDGARWRPPAAGGERGNG